MIADRHAGRYPLNGAFSVIWSSSSRAIFSAAFAESRLARWMSISAFEIAAAGQGLEAIELPARERGGSLSFIEALLGFPRVQAGEDLSLRNVRPGERRAIQPGHRV